MPAPKRGNVRESADKRWTNASVVALLEEEGVIDPVDAITQRARRAVLGAIDEGWTGPPFDPLRLADLLRIEVAPCADITDAQTVPVGASRGRIEYNPNRPLGRVRYSVAHEIAHTLFSDCLDEVRRRVRHQDIQNDEWQLEALCNVGAAEILMPFGALPALSRDELGIERVINLQKEYLVSTEAMAIRIVHLAEFPCSMFCASRVEMGSNEGRYRVDYSISSPSWIGLNVPALLPTRTIVADCTAIGYTAAADESWEHRLGKLHVEAVGIPPYPGSSHPRVAGLLLIAGSREMYTRPRIRYVRGSALKPRGAEPRIVVQIVNDKTANWGGAGFAQALRGAWPKVQEDFQKWATANRDDFRLGSVRWCTAESGVQVASVVAQKGYGESSRPRIRYAALREGLVEITRVARETNASMHMPRIGAGQAGGSWTIIEDVIRRTCCDAGVQVTVYDLPGSAPPAEEAQRALRFR
jgi:hypothetical protein